MWHSRLKHLCIMFPIEMLLRFANLAIAFLINCIVCRLTGTRHIKLVFYNSQNQIAWLGLINCF